MNENPDARFKSALRAHLVDLVEAKAENVKMGETKVIDITRRARSEWVRRTTVGVVVGATIAASAAGILAVQKVRSPVAPAGRSSTSGSYTSTPTPTEAAPPDVVESNLKAVTGRGRLTGAITGSFTISYATGSPVLRLRNLDVGKSKARDVLVSVDLASANCHGGSVGTIAGSISAKRTQDVELQDSSPQGLSDLSYMHALAIWPGTTGNSCKLGGLSSGAISWTLPRPIQNLASTDTGAAVGAQGSVMKRSNRLSRYLVAEGDQIGAVARRFGVSEEDLLYLNPLRQRGNSEVLFAGETLNLNPNQREYFSY